MHIHLELNLEKLEYLKFPFILTLGMSLKGLGHQVVIFRYTQPTTKLRQWNTHLFVFLLWLIVLLFETYMERYGLFILRGLLIVSWTENKSESFKLCSSPTDFGYISLLWTSGSVAVWWHELPARGGPQAQGRHPVHWWQAVAQPSNPWVYSANRCCW